MSKPDAEYEIAFRLFDVERAGHIRFEDFTQLYLLNKGSESIPFNWDGAWATLYLGGRKSRHDMTYDQFAQMLRGLQGERVRQAFQHFDRTGSGFIEPEEFQQIILQTAKHKLSDHLLENLPTLCNVASSGTKISYSNVRAFQNIIKEMDLVDLIVRNAIARSTDRKITRTDFLNEAARITRMSVFTPMEADILFHFAGLDEPSGRLSLKDFSRVLDSTWQNPVDIISDATLKSVGWATGFLKQSARSFWDFGEGAIAGALGALVVFPIDLVKTRMQNQRKARIGDRVYANSIDCARQVLRNEGFFGFYAGLIPQLLGVAPEKAIKLAANDLMRKLLANPDTGKIDKVHRELIAGGTAGACQVIFTNPLEIVKIRLQVQGEIAKTSEAVPKRSAAWIVRNLGLVGLYKGATACLSRDVPFSAIFFPTYAHIRKDIFKESEQKRLGVAHGLMAGIMAGAPSAYLTTPFDVIKTRLQVEARKGESTYNGLTDCARKVYREEGFKAFWRGGPARVLRSSPQFGVTLATYELLKNAFPFPDSAEARRNERLTMTGAEEPSVGIRESKAPLSYLRSRNALKLLLDLDEGFGLGKVKVPQGLGQDGRTPGWMGLRRDDSAARPVGLQASS